MARWLPGIFGLALLVRIAVVLELRHSVFAQAVVGDGHFYDQWARRIAAGDWIGSEPNFLAPLYAYFLAVAYRVLGAEWLGVRLIHALLGALSCALIADASVRLFNRRAGLVAGLVTALYAPLVWLEATIHKTALEIFLTACFLALVARLQVRRTPGRLCACGAAIAALALTRENAVVLLPVMALWLLLAFRGEARNVRLRWLGALLLGFVAVTGPFALRNRLVIGEWPITYNLGMNFYIGNHAGADGLFDPLRPGHGRPELERLDTFQVPEAELHRTLRPSEASRYWLDRTWTEIGRDPLRWLGLLGRKALLVFNAGEPMDSESFAAYADESRVLSILGTVFRFGVLAPLAALGLWLTRGEWRRLWVLYAAIVSLALSITLFFVFARIRISLAVLLIPFAAVGATGLPAAWKAGGASERIRLALLLLLAAAVVNWPLDTSSGDPRAGTYSSYGVAFLDEGRPDQALALLRKAADIEPTDAVIRNNLAVALRKSGDVDGAVVEFRSAVRLRPEYADAYLNLSTALASKGDMLEALATCREALRLQPDFPVALSHLGFLLYKGGDLPGAIEAWKAALRLDPGDVKSLSNLAGALSQAGDVDGAIAAYEQVLRLDPDQAAARRNLDRLRAERQAKPK